MIYPIYLALEALFGRGLAAATDFTGDWEAVLPLRLTAVLGYLYMMGIYIARGTFRDLDALCPVLRGGEATYAELRKQLTLFDRRHLWIGGLVGVVLFCLITELTFGRWTRLFVGEWSLRDSCAAVIALAYWMTCGWGAVYLIDSAQLYSRIGEQHVEIDLLDLGPLSPLTSHGLRIVLTLTIFTAVGIISIVPRYAPFPSSVVVAAMLLPLVLGLPVATAAFLLPVRGLRRHIRSRKAEELARVRGEIHRDRELVAKLGAESIKAGGRLPGLLAYKHEIESVREWPFDAPTLARFFLYVAIPLGSWVGGALVERLLGAALD